MIYVGIDDTDTVDSRGTNQLAKALARRVAGRFTCQRIVRHQLLDDPRVPYTSKNGSASIVFEPNVADWTVASFARTLRQIMEEDFVSGSDPGLCVATTVADQIVDFAERCQRELMTQHEAVELAAEHNVWLAGLGGTNDGMIGALAAVGLAAADDGGRVVQWQNWPDDLSGCVPLETIRARAIDVREVNQLKQVSAGNVDVGKHLRPNWRSGRCVLFVAARDPASEVEADWSALKIP